VGLTQFPNGKALALPSLRTTRIGYKQGFFRCLYEVPSESLFMPFLSSFGTVGLNAIGSAAANGFYVGHKTTTRIGYKQGFCRCFCEVVPSEAKSNGLSFMSFLSSFGTAGLNAIGSAAANGFFVNHKTTRIGYKQG